MTYRRFFVKVLAPSRRALVDLQKFDFDLFQATARQSGEEYTIEGLLSLEEVERLVDAGYRVLVEEHESKRSRARVEVTDFGSWLQGMQQHLGKEG